MTTKKTEPEVTTEALAEAHQSSPEVTDYGKPDADGNRYATRKEEGGVRVYLLTSAGRSINTLASTEAEGKTALINYLKEVN